MMRFHVVLTAGTLLGALAVVASCTGPDGPAGAQGPSGTNGLDGTAGRDGPAGMAAISADGGLPASCLSPCHGFSGIVDQWKTSTHFAAFIANLDGTEVATWTGSGPCGNCHAIDAIEQRVAANITTTNGTVANLSKGELGYRSGASTLAEASYAGVAKVASVNCVTCHSVTPASDPHRTGQPYSPGSFPLRVPTAAGDSAFIEKSADNTAVTGQAAGAWGSANTCVWCHKSRKDVSSYVTASNALTSANWGPHEGPQADIASGKGGYHYVGKTYSPSEHQVRLTCIDCHMPDVATNNGSPDHSFYARVSACKSCHTDLTSFNYRGGQDRVKAYLKEVQTALNAAGYLTRNTTTPPTALTAAELADGHYELDRSFAKGGDGGAPPSLNANQAGALYNYMIVARGSAFGIHNYFYSLQLLYDSLSVGLGVTPPATMTRPL